MERGKAVQNVAIPQGASSLELSDFMEPPKRKAGQRLAPGEVGPRSACVWFGAERLARLNREALAAGLNFSQYVVACVDAAPVMDRPRREKLEALAKLQGKDPLELLGELIDRAVSGAGF